MLRRWFVIFEASLPWPYSIHSVQPETSVTDAAGAPANHALALPTQSTLVNSAAGAAGALAGWAISSLGRKVRFYRYLER